MDCSKLPSEDPNHICGMFCDGQDGSNSQCAQTRRKLVRNTAIKPELRPLEQLRTEYANAARVAAEASADIALYEAKANKAKQRYEAAKSERDTLKRQIAEHPEA